MAKEKGKAGFRPTFDTDAQVVLMNVKQDGNVLKTERYDFSVLDAGIQLRLGLHGLSTILQQRTSDTKGWADKLAAMDEVYDRLYSGEWEKERKAVSRQVPVIIEVLAKLKGCEVGQAQKAWKKLNEEQQDTLREKYADEVKAAEEAREAAEVDLDDLL